MYLAVGLWATIILLMASPLLWVGWWLLADLGERATNPRAVSGSAVRQQRPRAV